MDTEPYPVVAGLLISYMEGGHVEIPYPECEMAMNMESGHVVDSVSRPR